MRRVAALGALIGMEYFTQSPVERCMKKDALAILVVSLLLCHSVRGQITNQDQGVFIKFVGFADTTTTQSVTVVFAGVSTQTLQTRPGTNVAVFEFTNRSPMAVHCSVTLMESRTTSGWVVATAPPVITMIPPYSALTRHVPVTATNVGYRITASCVEEATGVRRLVERGKEVSEEMITRGKTIYFTGRKYTIRS